MICVIKYDYWDLYPVGYDMPHETLKVLVWVRLTPGLQPLAELDHERVVV
jgi:hypothetical protein